jgi:hypothetical protein
MPSNNLYLTWLNVDDRNTNHISFVRSNDWGYTSQSISNISANDFPYNSSEPQIAVGSDENTAYLVWRDEVPTNSSCNSGSNSLRKKYGFRQHVQYYKIHCVLEW